MVYTHKQTKVQYVLNEKLTRRQPANIIILKQIKGGYSERFYRNQIEQLFTISKNMEKTAAEFKLESLQEDNDFKAFGLGKKAIRQDRLERFEKTYREKLESKGCYVGPFENSKIVIDTGGEYGILDLYPKANRVCMRKTNTWYSGALNFLEMHIICK